MDGESQTLPSSSYNFPLSLLREGFALIILSEVSESKSREITEDLLICRGFFDSTGAKLLGGMTEDLSQLTADRSFMLLGSESTVLSGCCVRKKASPPVASILFLEEREREEADECSHTEVIIMRASTSVYTLTSELSSVKGRFHKTDLLVHVQGWNPPENKWTP